MSPQIELYLIDHHQIKNHDLFKDALSKMEIARAMRYVFEKDQHRFIVARGYLKHLLAKKLGCSPFDIAFSYNEKGKPALAAPLNSTWQFNLSHAGSLIAIALHPFAAVGVDIEKQKKLEIDSLVQRFFMPSEVEIILKTAEPEKTALFFKIWVCKETIAKTLGKSIYDVLQEVELDLQNLPAVKEMTEVNLQWLRLPQGYVGAVGSVGEMYRTKNCVI